MPQLPALNLNPRNALADFSPINDAIDGNRRNALARMESDRQDQQLSMNRENQTYQRGRDQQQDDLQLKTVWGKRAQAVAQQAKSDPQRAAATWQRMLASHPNPSSLGPEYMDVNRGPSMIMAEAGIFNDPREDQMKDLEIQKTRAEINKINRAGDEGSNSFNQRAQAAQNFGLDANSEAGRSYILTGKLPREDQQSLTVTDKKAILEADENVGTNRAAIQAIDEAKRLNPQANSGWFANARAQVGANLPDVLVPDAISSPASSEATLNFDNAVVGQALSQMKSIFGGNPTEGERKILLDLQGSSSKPPAVRAEILDRARMMAVNRLKLNEQRTQELRGGAFYKPGGGSAASNPMSYETGAGDPLAEAKAAISKGADPQKVMQRLQQMGVDPRGLQ
jgi:hypothetical protein